MRFYGHKCEYFRVRHIVSVWSFPVSHESGGHALHELRGDAGAEGGGEAGQHRVPGRRPAQAEVPHQVQQLRRGRGRVQSVPRQQQVVAGQRELHPRRGEQLRGVLRVARHLELVLQKGPSEGS